MVYTQVIFVHNRREAEEEREETKAPALKRIIFFAASFIIDKLSLNVFFHLVLTVSFFIHSFI